MDGHNKLKILGEVGYFEDLCLNMKKNIHSTITERTAITANINYTVNHQFEVSPVLGIFSIFKKLYFQSCDFMKQMTWVGPNMKVGQVQVV